MQRPHWHTGIQGSLWPRPRVSGLAGPAEEQRTQKTGSPAGRGVWPASPSSVRKVRGPCPHGVCAQGAHPSFFLEHEQLPGWGKSMTGTWSWAPHPPRDPAGTQLEPSLCSGAHSFRPHVVSPTTGSSPRTSVLLSLALLSSRRLTAGLCPPQVPHGPWGPRALMLGPLQRCPGAPALIWGWCPEDTAVQALEVGQGARGASSRVTEDLSVPCSSTFTHSLS